MALSCGSLPACYQPVSCQQNDRSDHGTDEAGGLIGAIPADCLAEIRSDERTSDPERAARLTELVSGNRLWNEIL